ncbi:transglutaminase domain-containing protein [Flavobacterium sp.]|uniref:transglutaminase domain-containing protein n=1 Tax=Flavobacterium sp. TaxID=239 RepID=UPI0037527FB0
MRIFLFISLFFISVFSNLQAQNQYDAIDKKIDAMPNSFEESTTQIVKYINDNFSSNDDKIRAAFYWTASTISYDVENISNQKPNQSALEKVTNTLKSKKGICMHYAQVFYDIMNKLEVKTILVDGYTKDIKGKVSNLSHVWCASKIDEKWYLFDPTWGSGYVNDLKFTRKLNNKFYKAEPKSLIATHMPFDYLWQFSEYPINNQEFYDSKLEATNKTTIFDYLTEIQRHESLSDVEKSANSVERIKKNGLKNRMIIDKLEFANLKTGYFNHKESIVKLDEIINNLKEAHRLFGEFVKYRNNRFVPFQSDEDLKSKIQTPCDLLAKCQNDLTEIKDINKENIPVINNLKRSMASSKPMFDENLTFVNEFISKEIPERAKMFVKTRVVRR